jgi:hypothetical protein
MISNLCRQIAAPNDRFEQMHGQLHRQPIDGLQGGNFRTCMSKGADPAHRQEQQQTRFSNAFLALAAHSGDPERLEVTYG